VVAWRLPDDPVPGVLLIYRPGAGGAAGAARHAGRGRLAGLAILPYDAVRSVADPAARLLAFYQSAYDAGTATAGWDAAQLDTGRR
jgi:Family of unknown function (DUF5996)